MGLTRREFLEVSAATAVGGVLLSRLGGGMALAGAPDLRGKPAADRGSVMEYVTEPQKRVPLVRDVDVIVSGAGISGLFAALAAAKHGARVVLIDRFGELGGNMGPGMFVGGGFGSERNVAAGGRLVGLVDEFVNRVNAFRDGAPRNYATISLAVSRGALAMMREAGVEPVLSVYSADPIMDGDRVAGVFIESKSGRIAMRAKVVVDATGDADLARRAGAPYRIGISPGEGDSPNIWSGYNNPRFKTFNDSAIYCIVRDVDLDRFLQAMRRDVTLTPEEEDYYQKHCFWGSWPKGIVPLVREADKADGFQLYRRIGPGELWVGLANENWFRDHGPGFLGVRFNVLGEFDAGNWEHISLIEAELRAHAYDTFQHLRARQAPGFEKAYLVNTSAFLGTRGGPFIEGEHTLTPQEVFGGYRADDVMYVSFAGAGRSAQPDGYDMPYGMLLPKKIDGLLVTGRGAGYMRRGHDPGVRARINIMMLGQATGAAAALAAAAGVTPKQLNIKKLQRALLDAGFHLGDEDRLAQLGLASAAAP